MNTPLRSILRATTLTTASFALLTLGSTAAMASQGGTAEVDVTATCSSVDVSSTKDLSNVVLQFTDGSTQRFEDLDGHDGTFSGTGSHAGDTIQTIWVKSGANHSDEGSGYGERFDLDTSGCEDGADDDGYPTGGDAQQDGQDSTSDDDASAGRTGQDEGDDDRNDTRNNRNDRRNDTSDEDTSDEDVDSDGPATPNRPTFGDDERHPDARDAQDEDVAADDTDDSDDDAPAGDDDATDADAGDEDDSDDDEALHVGADREVTPVSTDRDEDVSAQPEAGETQVLGVRWVAPAATDVTAADVAGISAAALPVAGSSTLLTAAAALLALLLGGALLRRTRSI